MSPKEGSPGARVPGLEELRPIKVDQVSPSSLARYLLSQEPGLNLDPGKDQYEVIFQRLRKLPQPNQESLLVGFFENGVKSFPNGGALGRKLAEINNISWFRPEGKVDPLVLQGHADEHLSRLELNTLPLRIIDNWGMAWSTAWEAVNDEAWDMARVAAWDAAVAAWNAARGVAWSTANDAAWDAAWDAAFGAADDAARDAARGVAWSTVSVQAWVAGADIARVATLGTADGAAWVTVKDIMPKRGFEKGNPFSPLTEICKLGCCPIGVVPNKTGQQEFAVFIPQYRKPRF